MQGVIRDYHCDEIGEKKVTDWNLEDKSFDVQKLGLDQLSIRVSVGRNLVGFNFSGNATKAVLSLSYECSELSTSSLKIRRQQGLLIDSRLWRFMC